MPLLYLSDLFDVMKNIIAPKYGFKPNQIRTKIIGIRPGEKLTEYLLTDFEMENVLETKDFFILPSLFKSFHRSSYPNAKKPKNLYSHFEKTKPISKNAIAKMLKSVYR